MKRDKKTNFSFQYILGKTRYGDLKNLSSKLAEYESKNDCGDHDRKRAERRHVLLRI